MKAYKLREMTTEALSVELDNLTDQLFHIKVQLVTGQLENTKKIRQIRRDVARIKTILNERKRQQPVASGQ